MRTNTFPKLLDQLLCKVCGLDGALPELRGHDDGIVRPLWQWIGVNVTPTLGNTFPRSLLSIIKQRVYPVPCV
ncbi:hypothetical protein D3C71_1390760 [compost metagenome]